MAAAHIRIGDMLVAAGFVTEDQVQQALARQKESGRRLGEELVHLGFASEVQLTQVLSNQLSIPWVSLYHVQFSRELLNLIPAEMAEEHGLVPIYVRKVRREGDTLFVAMDDPTNEEGLRRVREIAGLPVKPMVAPPSEIRDAIRVYYYGGTPRAASAAADKPSASKASSKLRAGAGPDGDTAAAAPTRDGSVATSTSKAAAAGRGSEGAQASGASEASAPAEASATEASGASDRRRSATTRAAGAASAKKAQRMVTLTLLDGTEVRLPANRKDEGGSEERGAAGQDLTASDLVQALFARSEGADVSDVLPDARWERLFATLLTLLLRKGLIADWEFVDEWRKHQGS